MSINKYYFYIHYIIITVSLSGQQKNLCNVKLCIKAIHHKLPYPYLEQRMANLHFCDVQPTETRVSMRNCCHRGNITTRIIPPYSAKTVQSPQYEQTAPLSQISRFTTLSLTSKPRTQRVNYRLFNTQRGKMLPNLSFKPLYKPIIYCSKVVQLLCKCRLFLLGTILLPSSVCTIFVHYDIASSAFFLLGIHKHILSDNWRMVLLY